MLHQLEGGEQPGHPAWKLYESQSLDIISSLSPLNHDPQSVLLVIYLDTSDDDDGVRSVMFAALFSLHDIYTTSVLMVFDVTIHCKNSIRAKINIQLL